MYSLDLPVVYNPIIIIYIIQPRKLRACVEQRRAEARRGEAPLVNTCIKLTADVLEIFFIK